MSPSNYIPKHRRQIPKPLGFVARTPYLGKHVDHSQPLDADVTNARCSHSENALVHTRCPRHYPENYTERYARHATDSIGPL